MVSSSSATVVKVLKHPHLIGSFPCGICGKVFKHSASMHRHKREVHKIITVRKSVSTSSSSSPSAVSSRSPTPPSNLVLNGKEHVFERLTMKQTDQLMLNDCVDVILSSGRYSDEQLVLPETWQRIVDEAQEIIMKDCGKENKKAFKAVNLK
ncbi:hypothetical protein B9Z55_017901 [Caenorhabditis nigoni]|uniref:C2H2-type domain-containing protein n=1 Tax=Caenorhabditis nigoni TaxID=1611254 RepID=A0A2G5TBL5_9PELO|nr:hypothetical protein B9Z55_017901 [Caenorhabditis nigoni]